MKDLKFKTKLEFIEELGIKKSAFYRRLRKNNIKTTRNCCLQKRRMSYVLRSGFPPLPGFKIEEGQIETMGTDKDMRYSGGAGIFVIVIFD